MDMKLTRIARRRANEALYGLGLIYHDSLPITSIDSILTSNGLEATESAIYCGADGVSHEPVGYGLYLTWTWHRMESGRYEIVAYVN